jgi:hypothetical protein
VTNYENEKFDLSEHREIASSWHSRAGVRKKETSEGSVGEIMDLNDSLLGVVGAMLERIIASKWLRMLMTFLSRKADNLM